jgi:hypothetical protein
MGLIICILYLEHGLFTPNLVVIVTFQQIRHLWDYVGLRRGM